MHLNSDEFINRGGIQLHQSQELVPRSYMRQVSGWVELNSVSPAAALGDKGTLHSVHDKDRDASRRSAPRAGIVVVVEKGSC